MSPGGRRRRGPGPGIVTIYWRDIPAQVTATDADGQTEKVLLEPRFQHAIDRAAHVAGLTTRRTMSNSGAESPARSTANRPKSRRPRQPRSIPTTPVTVSRPS